MRRLAFYRRRSELPADTNPIFLAGEAVDRVAGQRGLCAERPVWRERVAAEEAVLARLDTVDRRALEVAPAHHRHAEAAAAPEGVRPLHALARRKAGRVAPVVALEALALALRIE